MGRGKEKCIVSRTEKGNSKAEEISDKISEATEIHDVNKNFCGNR